MVAPRWNEIEWRTADSFSLDGVNFRLTTTDFQTASTNEEFVFLKNRAFLESYRTLFDEIEPSKLVEIGFYHGAGAAFYSLLLKPEKVVCLDQVASADALKHHIDSGICRNVVPYFGIDQADKVAVTSILETEFPAHDVDMFIDDASHTYYSAKASFEAAFPFLREGGMYVIEDWGWAHWPGAWQETESPIIPGPGLSNLAFELVMIVASNPDLVREVHIDYYRVAAVRGSRDLRGVPLSVAESYLSRGRSLGLI